MARKKISELTAATTPDLDAVIPLVQSGQTLKYKPALPLNIVAFGASPSATAAANTTAIQAAINAANTAGGGVVLVPRGSWSVADAGGDIALSLTGTSNVTLQGDGAGSSVIQLASGEDAHVINIAGADNVSIRWLTIDGNRANQTLSVHGIRVGSGGCDGLRIDGCEIKECRGYGIGMGDEQKRRVYLSNLYVHDTGSDGIDIKNTDDNNEQNFVTNVVIENWGLVASGQAGLDLRGIWQVSGVTTKGSPADGTGIRFRVGELGNVSGLGAHKSHLTNFHCEGNGGTSIGVDIGARDVVISGGYITGALHGVSVTDARAKVIGVTAEANDGDGFIAGTSANDTVFSSCTALDNGDEGFVLRSAGNKMLDCLVDGNLGNGVDVTVEASDVLIDGCTFRDNGNAFTDLGTRTRVGANNIGLGGLVASSISEDVASAATSANLDIALSASTSYLFRVQVRGEDANGSRCIVRGTVGALRSGSGAPTIGTLQIETASVTRNNPDATPDTWLLVTPSASGNNLRVNVRNDMGADCHMTIRVWEIEREATTEDS